MKKEEINALIRLLDDPNNEVFNAIRIKLAEIGRTTIPFLELAWENTKDVLFQKRVEDIIHEIHTEYVKLELKSWVKSGAKDLFTGAYLIAKYQYSEIDKEDLFKHIDHIKNDIWLEINDNLTALEKIKIFNHVFFEVHEIKRSSNFLKTNQYYFINNVLNVKKGSPIALSIIYSIIAQELNIPVFGVNLPGNFILCYEDVNMQEVDSLFEHNVLFYINPFNKGLIFGKKEIEYFITQQKLDTKDQYFKACSNVDLIQVLVNSILEYYEKENNKSKQEEYKELLKILYF